MHFYGLPISLTMLTLLVLTSDYIRRTRSIPCLLMPRLPASPGHQRPLYWLCSIYRSLSLMREDFKYLCCVSFTKSSKIQRYFYISSNKFSTQKVKQLFLMQFCLPCIFHSMFLVCATEECHCNMIQYNTYAHNTAVTESDRPQWVKTWVHWWKFSNRSDLCRHFSSAAVEALSNFKLMPKILTPNIVGSRLEWLTGEILQ